MTDRQFNVQITTSYRHTAFSTEHIEFIKKSDLLVTDLRSRHSFRTIPKDKSKLFGGCAVKKVLLMICALFLIYSAKSWSQIANNTSLVGTVLDAAGNVVVGAKVMAVEESTKVKYSAVTNTTGAYSITFIATGTYSITVEQNGFKQSTKTGVIVPVDQAIRTDFSLVMGEVSEVVTVSADTPPILTDDATLGETFDSKQVEDLPMMSHNALEVASMSSNVYIGSNTSYTGVPPGEGFEGAGQREIQNSLTLDGVSIMNNLITTAPARPSTDMINQVQMQSGNYPAQYGAYLGIHINLVSKNGTDQLHGAAYDYVQNTSLNAYPFLTNPATTPKPPLHWNQYGFDLGGPVVFPKLYNGRDKTFFFGSYEKIDNVSEASGVASVLTPAMESGDFSAIGGFNPITSTCVGTCLKDPSTGAYYPNNQIPTNEINGSNGQIAQRYEKYMVGPNAAGSSNGTVNNLNTSYPSDYNIWQTLDRVDENIGDRIKLFVRIHLQDITVNAGSFFPANASYGPTNSRNYAIGYTHVLSSSVVNDFRAGVNKLTSNNLNYWAQNGLTSAGTDLGIPGFTADTQFNNPGVPVVTISGFQGVGNASSNWYQDDRTYDLYDEVSYMRGNHHFMAGLELRRLTLGREASNQPLGQFTFSAGQAGVTSTGYSAADFVLGYANQDQTPIATIKGSVGQWRDGFFALDNWQISPKLTVNYGLRYDLPTVPYSLNGFARILNPAETALIPTSNCPSGTACTGASYAPTPGFKFVSPEHDNWGPRIGVDYRVTEKLVARAGMGFYYNANQLNSYTLATGNYPFAATVNYNTAPGSVLTFTNDTPGQGSTSPVAGVLGTYVSAFTDNPTNKTQRSYQWNLDAGYDLWKNAGIDLEYLGSRSLDLDRSFYDNQPLIPAAGSVNSRRPNQLFGEIRKIENDAFSSYNALTAVLRQREFHGLAGQVSYTWSHDLDISADSNSGGTVSRQYNPRADYGNSNWDVRNRVVGVLTYTLPQLSGSGLWTREALGGWEVSAIVNVQSGMPFNVALNYNSANMSQGTERPNFVHKPSAHCSLKNYINGNPTSCIDEAAYSLPADIEAGQYAFGNTSRNTLYGPGLSYENLSLMKNFAIVDRLKFQFRAEAFNVFNHPSAGNPVSPGTTNALFGHTTSSPAQPLFSGTGFGTVNSIQQVPGTISGARVISLAGKLIF